MTSFETHLRTILDRGREEADLDGSMSVEAQHLLLALAAYQDTDACEILAAAGLDHHTIREALDREFERSLSAAGMSPSARDLAQPRTRTKRALHLGTSAKLALQRGFDNSPRKKGLRPAHVLLGILRAQVGTVPRALALADIDTAELTARVLTFIASESS